MEIQNITDALYTYLKILDPVIRKPNEKSDMIFNTHEMDVVQDILMLLKNKGLESYNGLVHKFS